MLYQTSAGAYFASCFAVIFGFFFAFFGLFGTRADADDDDDDLSYPSLVSFFPRCLWLNGDLWVDPWYFLISCWLVRCYLWIGIGWTGHSIYG